MTDKVHGNTKRAADIALARREISRDSHRAVHEGRITLAEAKELGRETGPDGPVVRINKNDRSRLCLCGCQQYTAGGRFKMGHDMRMVTLAKAYVRGEQKLTAEQREYLEESGKMEHVRARRNVELWLPAPKAGRRVWELSGGFAVCAECGRGLSGHTVAPKGRKRGPYHYYLCTRKVEEKGTSRSGCATLPCASSRTPTPSARRSNSK